MKQYKIQNRCQKNSHSCVPLNAQAAIRKPEQALWRGLLAGISQLVSDFLEATRNFILGFLQKIQLKIVQTISAHSKSTVSNFKRYCDEKFKG
jgi:hypothetical protein